MKVFRLGKITTDAIQFVEKHAGLPSERPQQTTRRITTGKNANRCLVKEKLFASKCGMFFGKWDVLDCNGFEFNEAEQLLHETLQTCDFFPFSKENYIYCPCAFSYRIICKVFSSLYAFFKSV